MSPATTLNSNSNMSQWHVVITKTDLSTNKSSFFFTPKIKITNIWGDDTHFCFWRFQTLCKKHWILLHLSNFMYNIWLQDFILSILMLRTVCLHQGMRFLVSVIKISNAKFQSNWRTKMSSAFCHTARKQNMWALLPHPKSMETSKFLYLFHT